MFNYTVISEPCIGQCPTTVMCSTRSLNRIQNTVWTQPQANFLYTLRSAPIFSLALGPWHSPVLLPRGGIWGAPSQGGYMTMMGLFFISSQRKASLPWRESVSGVQPVWALLQMNVLVLHSTSFILCPHYCWVVAMQISPSHLLEYTSFSLFSNCGPVACSHWRQKQHLQNWSMSSERHMQQTLLRGARQFAENKLAMEHQRKH